MSSSKDQASKDKQMTERWEYRVNGAQDKLTNMTDFIHPHDTDMDKENKSLQIIPLTAGTRNHTYIPWCLSYYQCSKNDHRNKWLHNEHVSVPYIDHKAKGSMPRKLVHVTIKQKASMKEAGS